MRLHDFLDYHAREHADIDFAILGDRHLSYAEAQTQTYRIANALVDAGLEVGERIAVLSKNSIEMMLIYYAASRVGVVPVPLNYRLAPPEWAYIITDAGAKLLICQQALADALAPVVSELGSVEQLIVIGETRDGWSRWEDFCGDQSDSNSSASRRCITEANDLYQMYTSGTTGRPKGAVLSHRAVTRQLQQFQQVLATQPGDRSLVVAPVYHAAAAIMAFATVQQGGTLYIQEDFVPEDTVRALSEHGITVALLVPAMIQFCLLAVPDVRRRSYDSLRLLVYGASPISEQTLREAMEVFKCEFLQGYGMTETTAVLTYLMPEDHRRALAGESALLASAGRPLLGTELRIVDDDDEPVANGTVGEIVGRGPQIMSGYWNLPEQTEKALRGGWLHTGDAGVLDDDGYLYIQDRVKDMIVSGGENVYPREIEDVLFSHPEVADAAVIGIPSERWGEEVKAVVVRKDGCDLSADDIMAFCKGKLGGYKQPRSVDFIDALPRNPSGKVLKKDLREPYWKGHQRRVG